ncbi:MAG: hypothetical protein KF797_10350, partial [Flavobacteriales bacterium]|nr:hypothetical protein [Flavobacteriales bacterium]
IFFGVADKPMPMAVMGTHLTSYKQGKAKPPVADLRYFRVRDERLEQRRRREEYDVPKVHVRDIRDAEMHGMDMVPDMAVAEPMEDAPRMVTEGRGTDMVGEGTERTLGTMDVPVPPPPPGSGDGSGHGGASGAPPKSAYPRDLEPVMARTTNQFIGTARLQYNITEGNRSATWTVLYASDSTRMVVIGKEERPLPSERNRAYFIDREAGTETIYTIRADSTLVQRTSPVAGRYTSTFPVAYQDSLLSGSRKINGRVCEHRLYEIPSTRRETWVDVKTPSLFHDLLSARKAWGGVEIIVRGPMITGVGEGMPMDTKYEFHGGETLTMKVLELKPGVVDPKVFAVTKESWR